jgi:predicted nucleotide-binding protein
MLQLVLSAFCSLDRAAAYPSVLELAYTYSLAYSLAAGLRPLRKRTLKKRYLTLKPKSNKCRVAIIVMSGDDTTDKGEIRARENVMHEVGFFQGKIGIRNVIILHEKGVNIPTNISGLVYHPYPKDAIKATYVDIANELNVLMSEQ